MYGKIRAKEFYRTKVRSVGLYRDRGRPREFGRAVRSGLTTEGPGWVLGRVRKRAVDAARGEQGSLGPQPDVPPGARGRCGGGNPENSEHQCPNPRHQPAIQARFRRGAPVWVTKMKVMTQRTVGLS